MTDKPSRDELPGRSRVGGYSVTSADITIENNHSMKRIASALERIADALEGQKNEY